MKTAQKLFYLSLYLIVLTQYVSFTSAQTKDDSLSDSRDLNSTQVVDPDKFLTGDWRGYRDRLIERGITPTARYYTTILGNPAGGERKGVRYVGLLNAFLNFDLEKLLNIGGTRFVIAGSWASGQSLSREDIGNLFNVSSIFAGNALRLYQMFLRTDLLESRLNFALGRMAIGDKFATSSVLYNYVSLTFNENPVSLLINIPGFLNNPESSWGAWIRGKPIEELYVMAGVYNSNPDVARGRTNGVDFSLRDGAILIGEMGYLHNQHNDSNKMPGKYKLGAYYDTAVYEKVGDDEDTEDGNYGFYLIAEQMVYRESPGSDEGLTPWAAVTYAPSGDINPFPLFLSGGLVYKGLFRSRQSDNTALAVAYGRVSDDIRGKDFEILFEATHIINITEWLFFQPDIQYIIHPGGSGDIPNALVIGFQLGVDI